MQKKYDYDVVVIGAGISGLVCGCYLAKAGLKTLIVEQSATPGGYCTSFVRNGFRFDSSVHYIGGVNRGVLSRILDDLEVKEELKFNQLDPTDKIIMPDNVIYIRANANDTIEEFNKSFPRDKESITKFFNFITQTDVQSIYKKSYNLTFKEVLDSFFSNEKLKSTLGSLLLGNWGLPPSKISGFASIVFYREFLLDPGYYPTGGMQAISDHLVKKFKLHGGEIILSCEVSEILSEDNYIKGVMIDDKKEIKSRFVVSCIDATQTFKHLMKNNTKEATIIDKLVPSGSVFIIYSGINVNLANITDDSCNIWLFSNYDLDWCGSSLDTKIAEKIIPLLMISFPSLKDLSWSNQSKGTMEIFTNAPYVTLDFWTKNKELVSEKILSMAGGIVPNIDKYIGLKILATPHTLHRYTLNKNGAAYGWASTPDQLNSSLLPQATSVKNLFLAGHWSIMGAGQGGISTAALSGKNVSEIITHRFRKDFK